MNSNTIVKIILFVFFTLFFGFLFWYFYQPDISVKKETKTNFETSNLFPFGDPSDNKKEESGNKKTSKGEEYSESIIKKEQLPKLRQISKIPTAGAFIQSLSKVELFDINKKLKNSEKLDTQKTYSEIRYISSRNNHVYQTYDFTKKENRISNITIPKVFDVHFFNKDNFIIRYINDFGSIKTYSVTLSDKTEEEIKEEKKENKDSFNKNLKKFQGVFFPDDIQQLYVNKRSQKVFYTTFLNTNYVEDGKIHGITSTKGAEEKKEIFTSDLKEWNFNFNNPQNIFLSNKVSSNTVSIPFSLNTKTAKLTKIIPAEMALNGIPNYDFSKIVFSQRDALGKPELILFNTRTKEKKKLVISTFVEKCVWSKNNVDIYCGVPTGGISKSQPDDWYKGKNYFRDDIYKINTNDFSIEITFDSLIEEKRFDIVDLKIDDRERYLYWKDKITDFIWSYRLPYDNYKVSPRKTAPVKKFSGKKCVSSLILTQNLQPGDRDVINEVTILQKHMNRLGFDAGAEDGILGKNTAGAIKRMQKFLGTYQDAKVGPITRSLLNNSC